MNSSLDIRKLITVDDSGMPCAPSVEQLLDKDVLAVYARDKTKDKINYIKEMGVVYYLGDPKSPAKQQGLSDEEALLMAIENFDLPSTYVPDEIVSRLIKKYYVDNITEAGVALEAIQKSIHLVSIGITRINDLLNKRLSSSTLSDEDIQATLTLADMVSKRATEIPALTKSIAAAYDNLRNETELAFARGGKEVTSSMDADEN